MNRQTFDDDYVKRLVDGDPQTEAHFFAYFSELILIKAKSRRLSHSQAEDVRQITLLRVIQALRDGRLRNAGALGAFVNSVCNHVLQEASRDRKRHQPPAVEPPPLPDYKTPSQVDQLIIEERQQAVRRVIDRMSPANRELLRQVVMEERDRAEICRERKVKPEYLRVLIHRAMKEFEAVYRKTEKPPRAAGPSETAPAPDRDGDASETPPPADVDVVVGSSETAHAPEADSNLAANAPSADRGGNGNGNEKPLSADVDAGPGEQAPSPEVNLTAKAASPDGGGNGRTGRGAVGDRRGVRKTASQRRASRRTLGL